MFFIPCDNWKTLFLCKFVVILRFISTVILLFFKQVWRELHVLLYLHKNSWTLIPKFQNEVLLNHTCYIFKLLLVFEFLLHCILFYHSFKLLLVNKMFLKSSKLFLWHVFYSTILMFLQILFSKWEQYHEALGTYNNNGYTNILKSIKMG